MRQRSKSQRRTVRRKLLALAIAQGIAATAQAATITVNSNADTTADDGACTLREAVVSANTDTESGAAGGECVAGSGADTIEFDSVLASQTITLATAGATGDLDVAGSVTIQGNGVTISGNNNSRHFYIDDGDNGVDLGVTLSGLTLRDGVAAGSFPDDTGGAIFNREDLTLSGVTLNGNSAQFSGGAIFSNVGTATLANSKLSGNTASSGGAVKTYYSALHIDSSTISGNSGGAAIDHASDPLTVTNSTISGNTASGLRAYNANATLLNVTLLDNTGAGLVNTEYSTLNATNVVIAGSGLADCIGPLATNVNNLIEDGSCSPALSGDPLLGPLADNGGATLTHAPLPLSPLIDAGDNATCPTSDQRGLPRDDGACDIGAYESQTADIVVDTAEEIAADGDCSLPEAVANANDDAATHLDCAPGLNADKIAFDPALNGQTITLSGAGAGGDLNITSAVTIQGPGAELLAISGNSNSRLFFIDDGDNGVDLGVTLSGLTLRDGVAAGSFPDDTGGAIFNREDLTLTGVALNGNSAQFSGGAIFSNVGTATLHNSTLTGNTASSGGAVKTYYSALHIDSSTISGNSGGAAIDHASDPLTVTNSTISGNTASGLRAYNANATLLNVTLLDNTGAGLVNTEYSTLNATNVVIAGSGLADCIGPLATNVNNLIGDGSCSPALTGDPLLGPLADNGGQTLTHAPLPLSPLIDAGDDGACPGTDQTGMPRPIDGDADSVAVCDIGAIEYVDLFGPTASINRAPDVTAAGGTSYDLVIDYLDDAPIDLTELGTGDVTVTGPGGRLTVRRISPNGDGTIVTYTLSPPGGAWDVADNGIHKIGLNAKEVFDTAVTGANAAAAATLGSFDVTIGAGGDAIFADGFEDPGAP